MRGVVLAGLVAFVGVAPAQDAAPARIPDADRERIVKALAEDFRAAKLMAPKVSPERLADLRKAKLQVAGIAAGKVVPGLKATRIETTKDKYTYSFPSELAKQQAERSAQNILDNAARLVAEGQPDPAKLTYARLLGRPVVGAFGRVGPGNSRVLGKLDDASVVAGVFFGGKDIAEVRVIGIDASRTRPGDPVPDGIYYVHANRDRAGETLPELIPFTPTLVESMAIAAEPKKK